MKIKSTLALTTFALLLIPTTALPWGGRGHAIIGEIAQEHLTPEAAAHVKEILGDETLAEVASWADDVRRDRRETAPFHYVNIDPSVKTLTATALEQEQGNVYMAVVGYAGALSNTNATPTERQEALKFYVHFLGDLHQPLHCGYAEDRGGNSVQGTYFGDATNLHSVWDSKILDRQFGNQEQAAVIEELMAKFSPEQIATWGKDYDLKAWIAESKDLLLHDFYPEPPSGPFVFAEEYQTRHIGTVEERLVQGGMRLAATLNLMLANEPQFPFEPLTIPLPIANPDSTAIMPPLFKGVEAND